MSTSDSSLPTLTPGRGGSPFETIRRVDEYGREYWDGRELMPLMAYSRWQRFLVVIEKARDSLALVEGQASANRAFEQVSGVTHPGNPDSPLRVNYRLSRFGAYLAAMAGDDTKPAVAMARVYFAVQTRKAELNGLVLDDINQTALARAREKIDYQTFRNTIVALASDYQPSARTSSLFFAMMQNKLYKEVTGYIASDLRGLRELETWPGREEGKPEPSEKAACRGVAKNYLTVEELRKVNRLVAILTLMAEEVVEDHVSLTLAECEQLVDTELALRTRRLART